MLRDRGWPVPNSQIELSLDEFRNTYGQLPDVDRLRISATRKRGSKSSNKILVVFCGPGVVKVNVVRSIATQIINKETLSRLILVVQNKVTNQAMKAVDLFCFKVEIFLITNLLVYVTKHVLKPKHPVLSNVEKKNLLKKYSLEEKQLLRMPQKDATARYYGLEKGQVVKVIYSGEISRTVSNLKLQRKSQLYPYHSTSQFRILESRTNNSVCLNVTESNRMITKLSRDGQISEARQLFDKMPDLDVIAWTSLISAYVNCGMIGEARELFDRVGAKKNVVTWTTMVSGYIKMNRISDAEKLFNEMPHKNVVSWNTMIDGYVRNGRIDSALSLFERMPERNVVSWNTVIAGLGQCGRVEEARKLFDCMPARDVISWTMMIAGLSKNRRIDEARVIFDTMPNRNVVSWNAMITGYAQNLRLEEALDLFERMPERDFASWNAMITGFIQNGNLKRAQELFDEMPYQNVVSWSTMIAGYVQHGRSEEALRIFSRMQAANGVKPNQGTFVSGLAACSNLAALNEGQQIHQVISKTVYQNSGFVVSALINMYSKCGELATARIMFEDGFASHRDLVSWNGMIVAYAYHGCGGEAINLFKEMRNMGIKPNDVTYVGLLAACNHAGLVEEGLKYFDELVRDGSIQVRQDHYTCLVDLYGRAGRLKEAFNFIQQLPIEPPASVWGALLAGCNVHGNTNIGNLAAKMLLEMDPENACTYMLLSNIYASGGKYGEAAKFRLKMKDKRLKKQPGCSWIDVGNKVNVFVVGDKSHSGINLIYSVLRDLHEKMKKVGYVSNNDFIMEQDFLVT